MDDPQQLRPRTLLSISPGPVTRMIGRLTVLKDVWSRRVTSMPSKPGIWHVEQGEIGIVSRGDRKGSAPIGRFNRAMARTLQQGSEQRPNRFVVVSDENRRALRRVGCSISDRA
jgi:hypothetical protein